MQAMFCNSREVDQPLVENLSQFMNVRDELTFFVGIGSCHGPPADGRVCFHEYLRT